MKNHSGSNYEFLHDSAFQLSIPLETNKNSFVLIQYSAVNHIKCSSHERRVLSNFGLLSLIMTSLYL